MDEKINDEIVAAELNQHISDALNGLMKITLELEAKQYAYMMTYQPDDLFSALYLFNHVASNIGIKAGIITDKNAEMFGRRLRELTADMTGYDTCELVDTTDRRLN